MKSKMVSNSPPVYSLRRIRAYDELKIISVTGVGQVRNNKRLQPLPLHSTQRICNFDMKCTELL